ncbi:MAG: hypothetical protein QOI67_1862 [Gaiellaceae bacterium]|nr:hypothetical protein [Gaiellaceae bacterium]
MTGDVLLVLGAALASGVEMIEAATIVLALGMSRGWRAPLLGSAAALAVLAVATIAVGPALERIPIDTLRLVVGTLVLLFGLQWLRKAILREAGVLSKHDEEAAFAHEVARARETGRARGPLDRYSWTLSFKSVLLEGLEVVFIVLTLGVNQGSIPLAATGAVVAAVVVGAAAVLVRRPLSRVPENALKFGVGVMLTAFGTFWAAEGAGAEWPGGDAALLGLVAITAWWSLLFVRVVRVRTA